MRKLGVLVIALWASSQVARGQATLDLWAGARLYCPALTTVILNLDNDSEQTQVISAGTQLTLDFSAPVVSVVRSGETMSSIDGETVTITYTDAVTFASSPRPGGQSFSFSLDLTGIADGTPVSVAVSIFPVDRLTLRGSRNGTVFGIVDKSVCSPAPAFTADDLYSSCPSPEEVAAIDSRLSLSYEPDPSAGTLVCRAAEGSVDLSRVQERTYQAFRAMQSIPFQSQLPWTDKSLYDWFTDAVRGVRFRDDIGSSFCCNPPNVVNLKTSLGAFQWPNSGTLLGLVKLLAHEARHAEGLSHTCGSNDATLSELGAWGVQYYIGEFLALRTGRFFSAPVSDGFSSLYRRNSWRDAAAQLHISNNFCDLGAGTVVAPTSVDFGTQPVGSSGRARSVAITWSGGPAQAAGPISLYGPHAEDFVIQDPICADAVVPGTCLVPIAFRPQASGTRSATLSAPGGTASLKGIGGELLDCNYSLARSNELLGSGASVGSLDVVTSEGCPWVATSTSSWLAIPSSESGVGPGRLTYAVAENTQPIARQATISVADLTFAVAQARAEGARNPEFTSAGLTHSARLDSGDVAAAEIVTLFGLFLADFDETATLPLGAQLGGATVVVTDSYGVTRPSLMFGAFAENAQRAFSQLNFMIPEGTPIGTGILTVRRVSGESHSITIHVVPVTPGIFTANASGSGLPAANTLRFVDGVQSGPATVATEEPIDLGPTNHRVFLSLFLTGVRNGSTVQVTIDGLPMTTIFGPTPSAEFAGLDQLNVLIERSLEGSGFVDVVVTVDGITANVVQINIL